MMSYEWLKRNRYSLFFYAFIALMSIWVFGIFHFGNYKWLSINDYTAHIKLAVIMAKTHSIPSQNPRPLYHLILNLLTGFSTNQQTLKIAAIFLLTVAVLLKTKFSFLIGDHLFEKHGLKISNLHRFSFLLILIFVSPIINWWKPGIYLGQFTPNVWHSPTTIMLIPFSLAIIYLVIKQEALGFKASLFGSIILAFSVLMKPSFAIVFLPALFLLVIAKKFPFRYLITYSVFTSIILGWQFYYLGYGGDSGVIFQPMFVWSLYTPNHVGSLLVSFSFPVVMTLLFRKHLRNTKLIALAWILVFVALGQFIFLAEEGPRIRDANFYWGTVPSLYILFLVLMVELVVLTSTSIKLFPIKLGVCYSFLFLHFLSGIVYFIRTLQGYNFGA